MVALYNQILQKDLYFFCPYIDHDDNIKYSVLKPGTKIQDLYKEFGKGGYLTICYADKHLGMQGLLTMEKWMIRALIAIVLVWVLVYGYSTYLSWQRESKDSTSKDL